MNVQSNMMYDCTCILTLNTEAVCSSETSVSPWPQPEYFITSQGHTLRPPSNAVECHYKFPAILCPWSIAPLLTSYCRIDFVIRRQSFSSRSPVMVGLPLIVLRADSMTVNIHVGVSWVGTPLNVVGDFQHTTSVCVIGGSILRHSGHCRIGLHCEMRCSIVLLPVLMLRHAVAWLRHYATS